MTSTCRQHHHGMTIRLLLLLSFAASALHAQSASPSSPEAAADAEPRFVWSVEAKANYRDSAEDRFVAPFPFTPEMLPEGAELGFMETVDPGSHLELSVVTLVLEGRVSPAVRAFAKIDFVDLYDRNPTSGDRQVDVDEAWIRFGRETEPALLPERAGLYAKIGKFPKFERQDDRHLESYGLVSTAFNRFEDMGIELGADLGRFVYLKASATQGNPVFLRDPNALAGDNGVDALLRDNPDPELGSGITIPYDAEIEGLDTDGDLELGGGLGFRWANLAGSRGADVLLFGYERELADTVEIEGSFYGGDLDLLRGPLNQFPFPIDGRDKTEVGANLWLYLGGFTAFAQVVDQDLAGLGRRGWELELAHRFELPLVAGSGGQQLFPWIAPAIRYSRLDPDFEAPLVTPSPSFAWEWEKLDIGIRFAILRGIDVTAEYARNEFVLRNGNKGNHDELLVTLRWRTGS